MEKHCSKNLIKSRAEETLEKQNYFQEISHLITYFIYQQLVIRNR